jgi:hypothetical protein
MALPEVQVWEPRPYGRDAYERHTYERHAYERHAYEIAPVRGTPMR